MRRLLKNQLLISSMFGLAFNNEGYRIGFGAGYYDQYLADFQGDTVSTIYSFQKFTFEPSFFDIPVKEVLVSGDL